MKTFEVYSLYDTQYRGRTLVAVVHADRFAAEGYTVSFFKDTFFSSKLISQVAVGGAFAVLDTEFSLSIEKDVAAPTQLGDLGYGSFPGEGAEAAPKKRSRARRKENSLDLS